MTAIVLILSLFFAQASHGPTRRPDGGVWAQPHKSPERLTEADVDTLMWPIVQRINQSGWVWTTESCQGHDAERGFDPLLGIVTDDIGRALTALSDAILTDGQRRHLGHDSQDPHGLPVSIGYFIDPHFPRLGRYQVRIVIQAFQQQKQRDRALQVFSDFAERVTTR